MLALSAIGLLWVATTTTRCVRLVLAGVLTHWAWQWPWFGFAAVFIEVGFFLFFDVGFIWFGLSCSAVSLPIVFCEHKIQENGDSLMCVLFPVVFNCFDQAVAAHACTELATTLWVKGTRFFLISLIIVIVIGIVIVIVVIVIVIFTSSSLSSLSSSSSLPSSSSATSKATTG